MSHLPHSPARHLPSPASGSPLGQPTLKLRADVPAVPHLPHPSFASEQYRGAAIQIAEYVEQRGAEASLILVTSAEQGAGKTLTSLNLALSLAPGTERRVLLLEGDLYRPQLHTYLTTSGPTANRGLVQALQGDFRADEVTQRLEGTRLDVMLAGGHGAAGEAMTPPRLARVLSELRGRYGIVLVDGPPLPMLANSRALLALASGTVIVARAGRTRQQALEELFEMVGEQKVVGVVLNHTRASSKRYYEYG